MAFIEQERFARTVDIEKTARAVLRSVNIVFERAYRL